LETLGGRETRRGPFAEAPTGARVEGRVQRRIDLLGGRYALLERSTEFTRCPGATCWSAISASAALDHAGRRRELVAHAWAQHRI